MSSLGRGAVDFGFVSECQCQFLFWRRKLVLLRNVSQQTLRVLHRRGRFSISFPLEMAWEQDILKLCGWQFSIDALCKQVHNAQFPPQIAVARVDIYWYMRLKTTSYRGFDSQPEALELHFSQLVPVGYIFLISLWHSNLPYFRKSICWQRMWMPNIIFNIKLWCDRLRWHCW